MCKEVSAPIGTGATVNLELLAGFVAANAIPIGIAVAADVALAFIMTHLVLVIVSTTVVLLAATVGRIALARWLLKVMGTLAVPCGLDRLRPPKPIKAKINRSFSSQPAIEARAPLAIEPPRTFIAGQVIAQPAADEEAVIINGTRFPVLANRPACTVLEVMTEKTLAR